MNTHQTSAVRDQASGAQPKDWRHRARCRDGDPERFFRWQDSDQGKPLHPWERQAKAFCRRCPALAECRAWSLDSGQEYGVSGGLAAQERRTRLGTRRTRTRDTVEDQPTREVRQLNATGLCDQEIAEQIGVSVRKVARIRARAGIAPALPPGRNRRTA